MRFFHDISVFPKIEKAIVSIGNFDGVHLGHKAIFNKMKEIKENINGNIVVVTFHPHPKVVLSKTKEEQKYIISKGRKANMLADLGIDYMLEINFTEEFAKTPTSYFIEEYLVKTINMAHIVVGYDCHFGHNYNNTIEILKEYSKKYKFDITQIPPVYIDGMIVGSTEIRDFLDKGMVQKANTMLGYHYSIFGQVIYGKQLGRTIGFPTANIFIENELKVIAAKGVYACYIKLHKKYYMGMCNIGTRPTVNGKDLSIEVNIFDFDKDIYGEILGVYFICRIRDEVKFNNLQELKLQLSKDKAEVSRILANSSFNCNL